MKFNWKVLGSRLGFGLLAAALAGLAGGHVPTTTGAAIALVGGGLASALPGALQASGVIRAASQGQTSLAQDLIAAGVSVVSAATPAGRKQAITSAVSAALPQIAVAVAEQLNKTGQFTAQQISPDAATSVPVIAGGDIAPIKAP